MLMIYKTTNNPATLHPQPRHQLFCNEAPIFDDLKAHLINRFYFLLKIANILALTAPQLRKRGNIPKVVYKSLYLLRHNCRLPALTCSASG